jgi:hypothetical protein
MTRAEIESRLKIYILNLCLAVISKEEGAIAEAKAALIDAVVSIEREAP